MHHLCHPVVARALALEPAAGRATDNAAERALRVHVATPPRSRVPKGRRRFSLKAILMPQR
jgi:hypothetical protein